MTGLEERELAEEFHYIWWHTLKKGLLLRVKSFLNFAVLPHQYDKKD